MSDRIAVMHGGRIEQVGAPEDLYDRPATPFVADFIGTTNLLSGTIEALDGTTALLRLDTGEACTVSSNGRRVGAKVQVCLRPEAIALAAPSGATGGWPTLDATVEQVAYLGAAVQYQVRTRGGVGLSVLAGKGGPRFETGDSIQMLWKPVDALILGEPANDVEAES